jgi:hypothetical protein
MNPPRQYSLFATAHDRLWLAAALITGAVGGLLSSSTNGRVVPALAGALVVLVAAALVMKDVRNGLYLMLLALPLDVAGRIITQPFTLTLYHLALLLTLISWSVNALRARVDTKTEFSLVHAGVLALLAAAAWSLPFSLDPGGTMVATVRLAFSAAFFVVFVQHLRDEKTMDRVLALVVATGAASAALALAQTLIPGLGIGQMATLGTAEDPVLRAAAFFGDPNFLAAFLSVGVVAGFGRAAHASRLRCALPWVLGALVASAGLVVTLSRTGWIGVGVGLLVCVATSPPRRRRVLVAILAIVIVGVVAVSPGMIVDRLGSITDIRGDRSNATRWFMVSSTLDMIGDHWVFGTGLDAYDAAYPQYRRPGSRGDILKPHELPFAIPAETGIMGLLAELLIIVGVVVELARRRHRGWSAWESVGLAGLLALLVQSLFQYYLYFEYLWLCLALTVAATRLVRLTEEV